jgi:PTH1 family peptidyl-tRNA hydrolase
MVADELAARAGADAFRSKFSGEMARARLAGEDTVLLKPMTFMNLSGDSVQPCAAFFKIPLDGIVVVHDELDLPFGTVRLKLGGGHAGHNGLRSIVGRLGTGDFARLRFGIGRPPGSFRGDVADWVLSDFASEEREKLPELVAQAAKCVLDIAARGFQAAMKTANTRSREKPKPDADEAPAGEAEPNDA